ncbi:hypothetical protein ACSBR2_006342 [Camellia fascicularis]
MVVIPVYLVLFLAMTSHSSATYCICKDGMADAVLQKDIDYACGAGADCAPIIQNGACYNPNTVKDHCNYAVNSYFQRKGQAAGTCDFSGTATTSQTLNNTDIVVIYYLCSTAGNSSTTTPSTSTSPTSSTTPSTSTTPTVFGLAPTGSGTTSINSKASVTLHQNTHLFWPLTLTLLFSGPMFLRL